MRLAELNSVSASFRTALLVSLVLALSFVAQAERLPIKTYTTADGLPRDEINRIVPDSRGYLWFCTSEGLSRFDGYRFVNYGTDQGLPGRSVNDFIETRNGDYWVATSKGVCRFNPDLSPQASGNGALDSTNRFVVYTPGDTEQKQYINTICEDRRGTIWCGTNSGLYRLDQINGQWVSSFVVLNRPVETLWNPVAAIIEDRRGALWISSAFGLFRRLPDGSAETYLTNERLPVSMTMLEDRDGQIWCGTGLGLYQLVADPKPDRSIVARVYTTRDGLVSNNIASLFQSSDGTLWVGNRRGLNKFLPAKNKDGGRFQSYTSANGLSGAEMLALAEDRNGNLWIGTDNGGAMKLAVNGFTTYLEADGLGGTSIDSILYDQAGELCVISGNTSSDIKFIGSFGSGKFTAAQLVLPKGIARWSWGWYQTMFEDSRGEWWINTAQGLVRYPRLSSLEQLARASQRYL